LFFKKKEVIEMKKIFLALFLFLIPEMVFSGYWESPKYADLLSELEQLGFSREELISLFSDPRVKFYPDILTKFEKAKRAEKGSLYNPYSKFLTDESVNMGREFLKKEKQLLRKMEKEYNVPKEIVVAILRVESRFGQNRGNYQAFGVFNSIIFYSKKNSRRSVWAKKEMIAFLRISRNLKKDCLKIKSSFAGAIGIPQFMPTSYLNFAVNKDKNENLDLFTLRDAVYSIANYLVENGWEKDKSRAIYLYNHSQRYVKCIEEYSEKIKK